MAGVLFWEKKCLQVRFEGVQRGGGKSFHVEGPKTEKVAGTNSTRNLEKSSAVLQAGK